MIRFPRVITISTGIVALVLASGLRAEAGAPREHDGFFLRLSAGGGTARSEVDVPGGKAQLSGATGDVNIAIGGIAARNLAIHGTIFGWLVSDPDVEIASVGTGTLTNTDLDLTGYGAGLTYYIMPANVYLSASAGAAKLTSDSPGADFESDTGFIGEFALGKEWWVGSSWGLGVSGAAGIHSIPDGGVDKNWKGASFALRFSATLN
jgi:hypothetical protein